MRNHPRSTAIAGGTVVVLAAITTGLAFAVLTSDRPIGAAGASSSPMAAAGRQLDANPNVQGFAHPDAHAVCVSHAECERLGFRFAIGGRHVKPRSHANTGTGRRADPESERHVDGRGRRHRRRGSDTTASVLRDGSVLVVGGETGNTDCLARIDRYDPANGSLDATRIR